MLLRRGWGEETVPYWGEVRRPAGRWWLRIGWIIWRAILYCEPGSAPLTSHLRPSVWRGSRWGLILPASRAEFLFSTSLLDLSTCHLLHLRHVGHPPGLRGAEGFFQTRTADIFYCRFAVHTVRTAGGSLELLREEIWFNYYHVT